MKTKEKSSFILCFGCAAIYKIDESIRLICPFCGYSVHEEQYYKVFNYAKEAVFYGFDYRNAYEKQFSSQGKITAQYALEDPATFACFIGIAALSGIIGNASYDLIKKIIGKIIHKSKDKSLKIGQEKVKISNETDINIFFQYIKEYHCNNSSAANEVNDEVEREKSIWKFTKNLLPALNKGIPSKEEIHNAFKISFQIDSKTEKPLPEEFSLFWNYLD